MDDMLIAARNKTHIQKLKTQLKKHERFERKQKDFRYEDHSRQKLKQTLVIAEELCSQGVEIIQHDRSKTNQHSFGRSLQIILQAVSTITEKRGGDVSSTIC